MLESVFLIIFMLAILLNVLGFLIGKPIFVMLGLMIWLSLIYTNSLNIQVPGDTSYSEWGLQAFVIVFVFIDIIYLIVSFIAGRPKYHGDWRDVL